MKILFDHQILSLQKTGGISRYFTMMKPALLKESKASVKFGAVFSENIYTKGISLPSFIPWRLRQLFYYTINSFFVFFDSESYDIYHPTYYAKLLPRFRYKKLVVTVYDMIHEEMMKKNPQKIDKTIEAKRSIVQEADLIIAISQATKEKLIEYYEIPENKIKVIYLAANLIHSETKFDLPDRYILFVGNRNNYKNFEFYVSSIHGILISKNISIVCFGGGNFTKTELAFFTKLGIDTHVIHVIGDDSKLVYAYKNAVFLAFPSLMEGFGLPILEAFSQLCPVLTSGCSSMSEISGDAAIFVNPRNKEDLYKKTFELINDQNLRESIVQKGLKRSKEFSWEKTSRQTFDAYKRVLAS